MPPPENGGIGLSPYELGSERQCMQTCSRLPKRTRK